MISVVRPRGNNSKSWRSWIVGTSGLFAVVATVMLSNPSSRQVDLRQNVAVPLVRVSKLESKSTESNNHPSLSLKSANVQAHTTKLEWQQGWQPNAWQLQDGDWPDEGGRFSEGQTYPEDPATFKIHQTYAFVPGHSRLSKGEADAYWTDLQKRFFRQTPSRTTYPAVPVIFDEDDEGGHSHVQPVVHRRNQIYINSMHYPHRTAHFKSEATKQSLSEINTMAISSARTASEAEDQLRKEYMDSEKHNQILERQLAQVEKSSNLEDSDPTSDLRKAGNIGGSMPFDLNHDAGESQDWKEVLFMQGALYEMQKKLAEQEDENQNLRNQLAKRKAKVPASPTQNVITRKSVASYSKFEQDQISELKALIQKIEQQQVDTEKENVKLHTQLSAIKKLTLKKAGLDSEVGKQSLKSLPPAIDKVHVAEHSVQSNVQSTKSEAVAAVEIAAGKNVAKTPTTAATRLSPAPAVPKAPVSATHASAAKAKTFASKAATTGGSNATVAAASVAAFRQASLATKDAVVRELAAAEESSIDSDAAAIFSGGTAVDEVGDSGRDGFDSLHSLERSALGRPSS